MKKAVIFLCFFAVFSICANVFWFYSERDFSPKNFQSPVEVKCTKPAVLEPASSYTYLAHGKQSMVFENEDQSHVLKLFYWKRPLRKRWYCRAENWLRFASPSWIVKTAKKRGEHKKLFTRYNWGYEFLPKETAIVHTHFSKTEDLILISLRDRTGKIHQMDLSQFPFVLQKKVELIPEFLDKKLSEGDLKGAREAIDLLHDYFVKRIGMGYIDNPMVFAKNYGFLDGLPVQIDIGRFEKPDQVDTEKEQEKVFKRLAKYVRKHYPELGSKSRGRFF